MMKKGGAEEAGTFMKHQQRNATTNDQEIYKGVETSYSSILAEFRCSLTIRIVEIKKRKKPSTRNHAYQLAQLLSDESEGHSKASYRRKLWHNILPCVERGVRLFADSIAKRRTLTETPDQVKAIHSGSAVRRRYC